MTENAPVSAVDFGRTRSALADQLDCYRQLAALSDEQSRHVFSGDTARLLALLERRQELTDEAARLEGTLRPIKVDWESATRHWSDADRVAVGEMIAESRRVLDELTRRDERDAAALRANMAMAGQSRQRAERDTRTLRRINQSYARAAYGPRAPKLDVSD